MDDIVKLVNRLVRIHETRNPFKIARYEGFAVKFREYDYIKGFYYKALKKRFIVVNQDMDEFSRMIVCAHELGHGLMHDIARISFSKEYTLLPTHSRAEREANFFAAELILTDSFEIYDFWNDGQPLDEEVFLKLVELKNRYGDGNNGKY